MNFSEAQIKALDAKLNGKHVHTRIEGDRELSYIEGWHAIAEANRVFGYDGWDREMIEATRVWQASSGGTHRCSYLARVRIRVRAGDRLVIREGSGAGHGSAEHAGDAHEQALKKAETDATKRALSTFGNVFGLALYDREQKGVKPDKRRRAPAETAQRVHKGTIVLTLSPTDLEVFERPEAFCSAFRQLLNLIKSAEELMTFWTANQETVIGLRERYPQLKTPKGVHYAQLLGELYTRRLQEFAERVPASAEPAAPTGQAIASVPRRVRDRDHLRHVAHHPCMVCGRSPAHAHHLQFMQPRALGRKVSDEYAVPLCAIHHRELHDAGNELGWWQRRKMDPVPVAQALWETSRRDSHNRGEASSAAG